ncbi:MAG: MogA/MoaB family molybdenum cofactor biosynthesis protein [Anaerolineales bacterium]
MSLRFGILTVSDRSWRGERADESGPALEELVAGQGWQTVLREVVPDDIDRIRAVLLGWSDTNNLDVILTTGGTGFAPRDVTPEATQGVIEREAPGIAEAMRLKSLNVTPHAMLSRARAGIRQKTLIVNLPGSPRGAVENLQVILPVLSHAVDLLRENPDSETGHRIQPGAN